MNDVPDFKQWDTPALVRFCEQAYVHMQTTQADMEVLRASIKDAVRAYRELVIKHAKEKQNDNNQY
jgi:hypothetical protein